MARRARLIFNLESLDSSKLGELIKEEWDNKYLMKDFFVEIFSTFEELTKYIDSRVVYRHYLKIFKSLGSGAYGNVVSATLVKRTIDQYLAIKFTDGEYKIIERDYQILKLLNQYDYPIFGHVYAFINCSSPIVQGIGSIKSFCANLDSSTIISSRIPGETLDAFLNTLSVDEIMKILIITFYYLHQASIDLGFTHYDLHIGNILFQKVDPIMIPIGDRWILIDKMPFIIDFGLARINGIAMLTRFEGYGVNKDVNPDYDNHRLITNILNRCKRTHFEELKWMASFFYSGEINPIKIEMIQKGGFLLPRGKINFFDWFINHEKVIPYLVDSPQDIHQYGDYPDTPITEKLELNSEEFHNLEQWLFYYLMGGNKYQNQASNIIDDEIEKFNRYVDDVRDNIQIKKYNIIELSEVLTDIYCRRDVLEKSTQVLDSNISIDEDEIDYSNYKADYKRYIAENKNMKKKLFFQPEDFPEDLPRRRK